MYLLPAHTPRFSNVSPNVDNAKWTYELWSSTGQLVLQLPLDIGAGTASVTTSDLTEGLYIGIWRRNGMVIKSHRQLIMK